MENDAEESAVSSPEIDELDSIDGVLWILDSSVGFNDEELQAIGDFAAPPTFVAHLGDPERNGIDWVEMTFGCVKDGSAVEWSNDGFRNVNHPAGPKYDRADCPVEQPDFRRFYTGVQGVRLEVSLNGQFLELRRGEVLTVTYRPAN